MLLAASELCEKRTAKAAQWLCLPNERDLDTWYEAVFQLPLAWPDITDIHPHYFKKTSAYQLLAIRTEMGVSHM